MREILQGVKKLFWNEAEQRLRAPLRFVAMFGLFLFALSMIDLLGAVFGRIIGENGVTMVYATAVFQLGQLALLVGAILAFAWAIDRRRIRDFGIRFDRQWWRGLVFGTAVGAGMAGLTVVLAVATGTATVEGTFVVRESAVVESVSIPAGTLLGLCLFVLVAMLWELIFRGYVLVNVAEKAQEIASESQDEEFPVRLLCVDSLTAHFRAEYVGRGELAERQQKLNKHLHDLMRVGDLNNTAVLVTNQVAANPDSFFGDPTQPIGGNILGHTSTFRLYLRKSKANKRIVSLEDAPNLPDGEAVMRVTEDGLVEE